MMRVTVAAFVSLILLATGGPSLASAQETDERVERARALFEEAEAHFAGGQYLPAAAAYQNAYDLMREAGRSTAPLILYNVGRAYDRAGRADQARAAYQRFIAEAPADDSEAQARVGTARERLRALRAPAPAPVRAGPSAVRAAPQAVTAPRTAPPPATESSMSLVGPIVMGAGGALLIAGFTIGGVALAQDGDLASRCPTRDMCASSLQAEYDGTRAMATAGDVLWVVGAAAAVAGLVLTFLLTEDAESPSASLTCGPAGCSVQGTF